MNIKAIIAIIIAFVLAVSSSTTAQALTGYTPSWTASNGTVTVGASSDGTLAYTTDKVNWTTVDVGMSKNGIRSLMYSKAKNIFVATGFFTVATSNDGMSWNKDFLPLGEKFNPSDIISDAEFFGATSMTVDDIQKFLNSKVPSCTSGYICLKDFTETTWTRDATVLCSAYTSEGVESAAKIIWKVSQACGVKAEILLVTLQKENSLVTHTYPSSWRYRTAMGYACPDTAPCDAEYFGFYNQVYNAAKQFKRYANPPGTSMYFTWYPVGSVSNIRWSPNADCGTSPVTIANQATAGLYYYTPYQPNAAALQNINGEGDACSAYGNRNFWRSYNIWFNTDTDYKTFVASNGTTIVALDDNGSVATSGNGRSWSLQTPLTISGHITKFDFDAYNKQFRAVTSSGTYYYSWQGTTWTSRATALPGAPAPAPAPSTTPAPPPSTSPSPSPSPTTSPTVSYTWQPKYYTVKTGDTLTKLATWYKTTVSEMARWNKLSPYSVLTVGQKIIVGYQKVVAGSSTPTPTPTPTPEVTVKYYTVVPGDTMWGISQKFNVSLYMLGILNPQITDLSRIYVGQQIRYQ